MAIRASSSSDVSLERVPPNSQKFRPKFDHHQLNSNPLRYTNLSIIEAISPKLIYIQIEDQDVLRYHRMQEELQLEFCTVSTVHSSTSPTVGNCLQIRLLKNRKTFNFLGNAYASQLGNNWYRVLIDCYKGLPMVFFVDLGHRLPFNSSVIIHNLPERFFFYNCIQISLKAN